MRGRRLLIGLMFQVILLMRCSFVFLIVMLKRF